MAAVMGMLNHLKAAAQAQATNTATPRPAGNSTSGASSASKDSATITANDFLTLLVTEMKNQDPTATTDPNEYINQLVNVNSLQQLISINETLKSNAGNTTAQYTAPKTASAVPGAASSVAGAAATGAMHATAVKAAPGNLSIPAANPAASRVAQSLSGRSPVQ